MKLLDRVRFRTNTIGTGAIAIGSRRTGFMTPAMAGAEDGDQLEYWIEDGSRIANGIGVYSAAGPTLSRDPDEKSFDGTSYETGALDLSGLAQVFLAPASARMQALSDAANNVGYIEEFKDAAESARQTAVEKAEQVVSDRQVTEAASARAATNAKLAVGFDTLAELQALPNALDGDETVVHDPDPDAGWWKNVAGVWERMGPTGVGQLREDVAATEVGKGADLIGVDQSDIPALGSVGAHLFYSPLPQDHPWRCDPFGILPCTEGMRAYFAHCALKKLPARLSGQYLIEDTVDSSVYAILGDKGYTNSGAPGARFIWRPTIVVDKKPCLRIVGGMVGNPGGRIEGLTVTGPDNYTMRDAVVWCPNPGLLPNYSAFAPGVVGIEITNGNRPAMFKCFSYGSKFGIYYNQTVGSGHIVQRDSAYNGWAAGLLLKKNYEGHKFWGGQFSGLFASVMFGLDGFTGFFYNTHLGFASYGFYQCIDGPMPSGNFPGLLGTFRGNFEQIGEAAIKLLPGSNMERFTVERWGFGWSDKWADWENSSPPGWGTNLHPSIIPYADQQKYAIDIGNLQGGNCILPKQGHGTLYPSPNTPGSKVARVQTLDIRNENARFDLSAFDQSVDIINEPRNRSYNRWGSPVTIGDLQVPLSRFVSPNLLKNPEVAANWTSATPIITDLATVGGNYPQQMIDELGSNPVVVRMPAPASGNTTYTIAPFAPMGVDPKRIVGYSEWCMGGNIARYIGRTGGSSARAYQETNLTNSETDWVKVFRTGHPHDVDTITGLSTQVNAAGGTDHYAAGIMLFYDEGKPYSNSPAPKISGNVPTSPANLPAGSLWLNGGALTTLQSLATSAAAGSLTPDLNAGTPIFERTAFSNATLNINAPSGTPYNGQEIEIWLKDNGAPHAIAWDVATYKAMSTPLPTVSVAGKWVCIVLKYKAASAAWYAVSVVQEA